VLQASLNNADKVISESISNLNLLKVFKEENALLKQKLFETNSEYVYNSNKAIRANDEEGVFMLKVQLSNILLDLKKANQVNSEFQEQIDNKDIKIAGLLNELGTVGGNLQAKIFEIEEMNDIQLVKYKNSLNSLQKANQDLIQSNNEVMFNYDECIRKIDSSADLINSPEVKELKKVLEMVFHFIYFRVSKGIIIPLQIMTNLYWN
jgi:hypothetical protein